ncbi:MAG: hypothetical protein EZS28_033700 [Streblomastix strix]|uniref:SPRY domain-containing protein n=1 Tax=Streblomastix strix TaxID=222440 RepID=A0A5J4UKP6_9EUKA|nr:MAG: hypothetical protein EZS28_033700 [Streblomastix strix]
MLETTNPRIRTLCGALVELVQQIGTESKQKVEWQILLSPLIQLLFNQDDGISEIGKQSLLKTVGKNPEALFGLVEIGLFDRSAEVLEITFPQQQTASQSSSSSLQNAQYQFSQTVVLNILEVIEKVIRSGSINEQKTAKFVSNLSRIKQLKLPKQIKSAIGAILFILQDDDDEEEDRKETSQLEKIPELIEQQKATLEVKQLEQKLRETEEQLYFTEEKLKNKDNQLIRTEERARNMEDGKNQSDQRIRELENTQYFQQQYNRGQIFAAQRNIDQIAELEDSYGRQSYVKLERVDGLLRKAIAIKDVHPVVVPLNKVMRDGIHRITVKFQKCYNQGSAFGAVGIVEASHRITCPCNTEKDNHNHHMLDYAGNGCVCFKGIGNKGNSNFKIGEPVTLELNMDKKTLHFFVNDMQQPFFVRGINDAVKFYGQIAQNNSSFTITLLEELNTPIAKHVTNEIALNW